MKWLIAYISLLLATQSSLLQASADNVEILVVTSESDGIDESSKDQKLYPGEIIAVVKYDGKRALVQRVENQPSTIRYPERKKRNSVWLLLSNTAKPTEFVKVAQWHMDGAYSVNIGPDGGINYFFAKDGTFTASIPSGNELDADPPVIWNGHLNRMRNIIWARPDGQFEPVYFAEQIFILESNGQLCDAGGDCFQ